MLFYILRLDFEIDGKVRNKIGAMFKDIFIGSILNNVHFAKLAIYPNNVRYYRHENWVAYLGRY